MKGITAQELVKLGDLDNPSNSFTTDVRKTLDNLKVRLSEESNGLITSLEQREIAEVRIPIEWKDSTGGFGYVSSSTHQDYNKEVLWSAIVANSFRDKDNPMSPLVISMDDFYSYSTVNPSLTRKVRHTFSRENLKDDKGRPYAIVLSNFLNSKVFTEDNLLAVPHQDQAFKGNNLFKFAESIILKEYSTLSELLSNLKSSCPSAKDEDLSLLLCTSLVLQDFQSWQDLSYEGSRGEGTPLYIVAPRTFHDAMNRLNLTWGHGAMDYNYRASCSLRSHNYPPFEIVDGKVKTKDDCIQERLQTLGFEFKGLSNEDFNKRVCSILDSLMKVKKDKK